MMSLNWVTPWWYIHYVPVSSKWKCLWWLLYLPVVCSVRPTVAWSRLRSTVNACVRRTLIILLPHRSHKSSTRHKHSLPKCTGTEPVSDLCTGSVRLWIDSQTELNCKCGRRESRRWRDEAEGDTRSAVLVGRSFFFLILFPITDRILITDCHIRC